MCTDSFLPIDYYCRCLLSGQCKHTCGRSRRLSPLVRMKAAPLRGLCVILRLWFVVIVRLHTSHEVALLSCRRKGRGVGKDHTCVYIELIADSGRSSQSVKMNRYTFFELADMHLCFGLANANAARRYYAQRFPRRNLPSVNFFSTVDRR